MWKPKTCVLTRVLSSLFRGTNVTYQIRDRHIILSTNQAEQQPVIKVSGKVTDSSGMPLPGVTVLQKGTTNGIVTDVDGNYTLGNVPGGATLVFSFVGMRARK